MGRSREQHAAHAARALVGVLGGAITGYTISSSASRKIDSGTPLGGAHLAAMSVGTVLGGAALGALAGALLVNPSGTGTFLGSDEQTLVLLTTVGAGFGVFCLRRHWNELTGESVEVRPDVLRGGRPGVVVSIHF